MIINWLKKHLGQCNNSWLHDWKISRNSINTEIGDTRICSACGARQVCVGYYSFMDSDAMPQWAVNVIENSQSSCCISRMK
mgnify:CR=1 FL=1